jgi:hypothetical protein
LIYSSETVRTWKYYPIDREEQSKVDDDKIAKTITSCEVGKVGPGLNCAS